MNNLKAALASLVKTAQAAASVKRTRYAGRYYMTTRWITPPPQRDLFEEIGG